MSRRKTRFGPVCLALTVAAVVALVASNSALAGGGCGGSKGDEKPLPKSENPPKEGAQPKWTVEKETVTIDPVWAGEAMKFTFNVGNEGDADMRIRIKGG